MLCCCRCWPLGIRVHLPTRSACEDAGLQGLRHSKGAQQLCWSSRASLARMHGQTSLAWCQSPDTSTHSGPHQHDETGCLATSLCILSRCPLPTVLAAHLGHATSCCCHTQAAQMEHAIHAESQPQSAAPRSSLANTSRRCAGAVPGGCPAPAACRGGTPGRHPGHAGAGRQLPAWGAASAGAAGLGRPLLECWLLLGWVQARGLACPGAGWQPGPPLQLQACVCRSGPSCGWLRQGTLVVRAAVQGRRLQGCCADRRWLARLLAAGCCSFTDIPSSSP